MNWKIVSAFVTGAVMASGIVYMAVRPVLAPTPKLPTVAMNHPLPQLPPAPAVVPPPALATGTPEAAKPVPRVVREKPSPMPPPVRRERPAAVARNQAQLPPQPPPQPVEESPPVEPPPPAPQSVPEPAPAPTVAVQPDEPATIPETPGRTPNTVVLAAGTVLTVRIGETISASRNQIGDNFLATLEQPLVIDGFIIAERGSRAEGKVTEATPAGRGGGASHLEIGLVRLSTSDGQRIRIRTEPYKKDGSGSTGSDLAKVGAGAAIGAAIGAIAGGGKGAAIGAGAGAAAGAGTVLIMNGKSVEIPVETRITFRVQEPVTLTEKIE